MVVRKRTRAVLICFTGLDGSGKSTLARALVAALEERGIESRYVYSRFEPLLIKPVFVLGRILFLRGQERNEDYHQYSATRGKVFNNACLAVAYKYLILLDYWWQILLRVWIPLKLGRTIVCDRYTYDMVINLTVDLSYSHNRMDKVLDRFSRLLPTPELVFVMDVPEEIAFQRKNDIPSMDYLRERRKLYLHLGRKWGAIVLDSTENLKELEGMVRDKVLEGVGTHE